MNQRDKYSVYNESWNIFTAQYRFFSDSFHKIHSNFDNLLVCSNARDDLYKFHKLGWIKKMKSYEPGGPVG